MFRYLLLNDLINNHLGSKEIVKKDQADKKSNHFQIAERKETTTMKTVVDEEVMIMMTGVIVVNAEITNNLIVSQGKRRTLNSIQIQISDAFI